MKWFHNVFLVSFWSVVVLRVLFVCCSFLKSKTAYSDFKLFLCIGLILGMGVMPAIGQAEIQAELIVPIEAIVPGESFWVGVSLTVPEGAHTYSDPSGDSGLPTRIAWDLPEGVEAGPIEWPKPSVFKEADLVTYGYQGPVVLPVRFKAASSLVVGELLTIAGTVYFLECAESCIPRQVWVSQVLPVKQGPVVENAHAALFKTLESKEASFSFWGLLLAAFLGGVILNAMPCVFPVIGLKILHFVESAEKAASAIRWQGLFFTGGVLVSFWVLAGLLLILRQQGEAVGWGFQLQNSGFVLFLITLLFMLGLVFLGVFEVGLALTGITGIKNPIQHAGWDAFLSGILATLVATPCTAPFMGAALGAALTQPYGVAFAIFTSLGLGMSAPYLVLSYFPQFLRYLPKPGAWMETFKQCLAFPLFATVIWLLWVLSLQTDSTRVIQVLFGLWALAFGGWAYGRWGGISQPLMKRRIVFILFLLLGLGVVYQFYRWVQAPSTVHGTEKGVPEGWEPFSLERLEALRKDNRIVFVDVTAAWCLTCQANFYRTLQQSVVVEAFHEKKVVKLWADWTDKNAVITDYLLSLGRSGVPVYALYLPGQHKPMLLPEILGVEDLLIPLANLTE